MRKLFVLGAVFVFSLAMLMTACKKDETNNNGNNSGNNNGNGTSGGNGGAVAGYVDLGLPSHTKWKTDNEIGGYANFFTYDEAVSAFGNKLPTMEQLRELKSYCTWEWQNTNKVIKVTGTNGNYIFLPALGCRDCIGNVNNRYLVGYYWSSTPDGSDNAKYLDLRAGSMIVSSNRRCYGHSVRLVQR